MAERRRIISTPGERRDPARRGPGTVVLSVVVHVVAALVLIQLTFLPSDWIADFMREHPPTPVERIGFLQLPRGAPPTEAPRRGGDNRPLSNAPAAASQPLPVMPVEIPSSLPPIPTRPLRASAEVGNGPLVGGGGDTRGVRPSYSDPRLWVPSSPTLTAPLAAPARLDSAMAPLYRELADSMRRAAGGRDPSDWTMKIGGQKYGIDKNFIRLGPVSIPTPLLALLPLNQAANPTAVDRDRRLSSMRAEILQQSARAARDEDFRSAVKALRERKEKERADAKKADVPPAKIVPEGTPVTPR
jgi:hypothetical protein